MAETTGHDNTQGDAEDHSSADGRHHHRQESPSGKHHHRHHRHSSSGDHRHHRHTHHPSSGGSHHSHQASPGASPSSSNMSKGSGVSTDWKQRVREGRSHQPVSPGAVHSSDDGKSKGSNVSTDWKQRVREGRSSHQPVSPGAVHSSGRGKSPTNSADWKQRAQEGRPHPPVAPGAVRSNDGSRSPKQSPSDWKQRVRGDRSPRTSPRVEHVTTSDHPGSRKASKFKSKHSYDHSRPLHSKHHYQGSKTSQQSYAEAGLGPLTVTGQQTSSNDHGADLTLEAFAAPAVAEEDEYTLEQRENEGHDTSEIDVHGDTQEPATATAATRNEKKQKRAVIVIVLVVLLLGAAGVTTWLLLGRDSTTPDIFQQHDELCLSISKGLSIEGQDEMEEKTVGVETEFAVEDEVNLALLEAELRTKVQTNVLPLLAGCNASGPVSNNSVANALLRSIVVGSSVPCSQDSKRLCYLVDLQVDLFLSKEESNESLLGSVSDVFQGEVLLELLMLSSPVDEINVLQVFVLLPTDPPSQSPTEQDDDEEEDTCSDIAAGTPVSGQDNLIVKEYNVLLDVSLQSDVDMTEPTIELGQKMQSLLMPTLAGCNANRPMLESESLILNAMVDIKEEEEKGCLPTSEIPCHRYTAHIDIYVESIVASADFSDFIIDKFRELPLVDRLDLGPPFKTIVVVDILSGEASSSPTSCPSASPTFSPLTYPATDAPTESPTQEPSFNPTSPVPTKSPTQVPSGLPSSIPIAQPVVSPTLPPTLPPTSPPTPSPTPAPTPLPTMSPSSSPSQSPTPRPSSVPSSQPSQSPSEVPLDCFQSNSDLAAAVNDWFDSGLRASVETQYGSIGDWCFRPEMTDMSYLFDGRGTFNEDISRWDVSSVTTMRGMFAGASSFNQDLSTWDVSSVTDMFAMFHEASSFNQDLSTWDVSSVTTMVQMFLAASSFNQDLSTWNVSSNSDMAAMFRGALSFNQDLSTWDVSSVTYMHYMFFGASSFNQDLSTWDVSSVTLMGWMFYGASSFNQDLSTWDVSSVTQMRDMFAYTSSFNQDLSTWNVSSVTDIRWMFYGASSFNQNLCDWGSRLPPTADTTYAFSYTTNCPTQANPMLSANPPGPFCHVC